MKRERIVSERQCLECGVVAADDAAFCESCGSPIAGAVPVPARRTGRAQRHGYTLQRKTRKASGALLAVAIIQTIGALVLYNELSDHFDSPVVGSDAKLIAMIGWALAGTFWGLWWWSRSNPFVAGIVGLTLYVTLHFLAALVEPKSLASGIIIKVIVIVVLAKAISAGAEYRRMTAHEER